MIPPIVNFVASDNILFYNPFPVVALFFKAVVVSSDRWCPESIRFENFGSPSCDRHVIGDQIAVLTGHLDRGSLLKCHKSVLIKLFSHMLQ